MEHLPQRLNKVLSQLGYGSRRAIDVIIEHGRIMVNGKPALLGQKVLPSDMIKIDGKEVPQSPQEQVILAFHKPRGVTTTKKDPFAKVTVMDFLPRRYQKLYPIGRLDRMSRGLLLLTNDGDLAYQLTHPRFEHEKEYSVQITPQKEKTVQQFTATINQLNKETVLPESQAKPVHVISHSFHPDTQIGEVRLILEEGKNRQIRHIFDHLGYEVIDLLRTRINTISLDQLPEGAYRVIDRKQLKL